MNLSLGVDARLRQGRLLVFSKTATRIDLEMQPRQNQGLKRGNIFFMFAPRADDIWAGDRLSVGVNP